MLASPRQADWILVPSIRRFWFFFTLTHHLGLTFERLRNPGYHEQYQSMVLTRQNSHCDLLCRSVRLRYFESTWLLHTFCLELRTLNWIPARSIFASWSLLFAGSKIWCLLPRDLIIIITKCNYYLRRDLRNGLWCSHQCHRARSSIPAPHLFHVKLNDFRNVTRCGINAIKYF
jgi:hypothetical protein